MKYLPKQLVCKPSQSLYHHVVHKVVLSHVFFEGKTTCVCHVVVSAGAVKDLYKNIARKKFKKKEREKKQNSLCHVIHVYLFYG